MVVSSYPLDALFSCNSPTPSNISKGARGSKPLVRGCGTQGNIVELRRPTPKVTVHAGERGCVVLAGVCGGTAGDAVDGQKGGEGAKHGDAGREDGGHARAYVVKGTEEAVTLRMARGRLAIAGAWTAKLRFFP